MNQQQKVVFGLALLLAVPAASAENYASKERSNAAIGHYARARAMLVEALAEFEQGRKFARPDMLLDSEEWRLSIISRTEELNRILDPRPRVSRDGVRFQANKLLIRRERDRLPTVADGAQSNSVFGEEQRKKEMQAARARLDEMQAEVEARELEEVEAAEAAKAADKSKKSEGKQKRKDPALDEAINALSAQPSAEGLKAEATKSETAKKVEAPAPAEAAKEPESVVVEGEEEEVETRPGAAEESLFGPSTEKEVAKKPAAEPAPKSAGKKISLEPSKPVPLTEKQEDQVSQAIDDAIKQRAQTIESNAPKSSDPEADEAE